MTPDEAAIVTRLVLRVDGCCTTCAGEFIKSLADTIPDVEWLDLVAEIEPDTDVLTYILNPEELYQ